MAWTTREKIHHLAELHEESRYYRRFHHTVFSVTVAGYVALIVVQVQLLTNANRLTTVGAIASAAWTFVLIALVVLIIFITIPGLVTYLFVRYHSVHGCIQGNIRSLQKDLRFPDRYLGDVKYEDFAHKGAREQFFIGVGHKVFISVLWLMVIVNVIIFYILLKAIN